MNKCGYFQKYQATRAPTCGCEGCKRKWDMITEMPIPFDTFSLQETEGGVNLFWTFVSLGCNFYIEHWDYKGTDQSYIVVMFGLNGDVVGFDSDNWISVLKWLKEKRLEYDKQIKM